MLDLINKHIANGFSDFKGLKVEGSVPITEETINEFISELLTNMAESSSSTTAAASSSNLDLDIRTFLRLVKKAEIKAEQGKVTLVFEVLV